MGLIYCRPRVQLIEDESTMRRLIFLALLIAAPLLIDAQPVSACGSLVSGAATNANALSLCCA